MASTRANNQLLNQQLLDRASSLSDVRDAAVARKADSAYQTPVQQSRIDQVIDNIDQQQDTVADETLRRSNLNDAYTAAAAKVPRLVNLDNDPEVKAQMAALKDYRRQHPADYPKNSLTTPACAPCTQTKLDNVQPWAYTASTNIKYDQMLAPKGPAYTAEQIVSKSHYNDPIDTTVGRLAGNSRVWGDASAAVQKGTIDTIIKAAEGQGLTKPETAQVLAIAYTESGFNPDAAAGTTSASGLGQFTTATGASYGLDKSNHFDATANADALVQYYQDNRALAEKNHPDNVDEYVYAYHHDGPTLKYGGLGISQSEVMPRMKEFEGLL